MNPINRILLITMIISSTACSYIPTPSFVQNRDKSYLGAKSIPPLHIPPGMTTHQIRNDYPISDRNYPESSKDISQVPPGLYTQ